MKVRIVFSTLLIFTVFAFWACNKTETLTVTDPFNPTTNINANVSGRVVNTLNEPIVGATVKAGAATATTNANGEFTLSNADLYSETAFVTVEKTGYFNTGRTFVATDKGNHYVEIAMLDKTNVGTITASIGGTVTATNGSSLTLPAGSVVTESGGAAYTGAVTVYMNYISPTSADVFNQMPGDLRGIDEAGGNRTLETYGMIAAELRGAGGEKLQITKDKKATLVFPLDPVTNGNSPAKIDLWSFDEKVGLWKQEGTATKSNGTYLAQVSHFSWWNCDAPFLQCKLKVRFVDANGNPMRRILVTVRRTSQARGLPGFTDSNGVVSGIVPASTNLVVEAFTSYSCVTQGPLWAQNVGPFTPNSSTDLGTKTITQNNSSLYKLTGTVVNCSNTNIANGYVRFFIGSYSYNAAVTNGAFSINIPTCISPLPLRYFAYDAATGKKSKDTTRVVTALNSNLGTIKVCDTVVTNPTTAYFIYTINGQRVSADSTGYNAPFGTTVFTEIWGVNDKNNPTAMSKLNFTYAGDSVGIYNLNRIFWYAPGLNSSPALGMPQSTVSTINITQKGYINGVRYLTGRFNSVLKSTNLNDTTVYPINCEFRIKL